MGSSGVSRKVERGCGKREGLKLAGVRGIEHPVSGLHGRARSSSSEALMLAMCQTLYPQGH